MAIAQMQKVMIVSHRSEVAKLLDALQASGICQVLNAEQAIVSKEFPELHVESQKPRDTEELVSRLGKALTFLKEFAKSKTSLLAPKMVIDRSQYEKIVADKSFIDILENTEKVKDAIESLKNEIENHSGKLETLAPWENLSTPVEQLKDITKATAVTGLIPVRKFDHLTEQIVEFGVGLEKIGQSQTAIACLIVCLNEHLAELNKTLRGADFEAVIFESMTGTVAELIEEYKNKLSGVHNQLNEQFGISKLP